MFELSDLSEVKNVGIFIDGENISHKDINYVFEEIKKYGRIIVKRVYCDWKTKQAESWVQKCQEFGIEEMHCSKVAKKSSVDFKLVDDIYDFLYVKKTIDIFVLVSNDGDFVSVIRKARCYGKICIVLAYNYCSEALKNSSDIFISIDLIKNKDNKNDNKLNDINLHNTEEDLDENGTNEILENDEISQIKSFFSEDKKFLLFSDFEEQFLKNNKNIKNLDQYIHEKYKDLFLIKTSNNKHKNIYNLLSIDSVQYTTLYEQIKAIFIHYDREEMALTILKEKLVMLTTKFDQRIYGFQKFKDFMETLYSDKFNIINDKLNSHVVIKLL